MVPRSVTKYGGVVIFRQRESAFTTHHHKKNKCGNVHFPGILHCRNSPALNLTYIASQKVIKKGSAHAADPPSTSTRKGKGEEEIETED
jgi:hypothetical protein